MYNLYGSILDEGSEDQPRRNSCGAHVGRPGRIYVEAKAQIAAAAYEGVSADGNGGRKLITQAFLVS